MRYTVTVVNSACDEITGNKLGKQYPYPCLRFYLDVRILDEHGNELGTYRADGPVTVRLKKGNEA